MTSSTAELGRAPFTLRGKLLFALLLTSFATRVASEVLVLDLPLEDLANYVMAGLAATAIGHVAMSNSTLKLLDLHPIRHQLPLISLLGIMAAQLLSSAVFNRQGLPAAAFDLLVLLAVIAVVSTIDDATDVYRPMFIGVGLAQLTIWALFLQGFSLQTANGRLAGPFTHPTGLAQLGFVGLCLRVLYPTADRGEAGNVSRVLDAALIFSSVLLIVASSSRAYLLAALVLTVADVIRRGKSIRVIRISLAVFMVGTLALSVGPVAARLETLDVTNSDTRQALWSVAVPSALRNLPEGVGYRMSGAVLQRNLVVAEIPDHLESVHNLFIQATLELGLVGMICYFGWLVLPLLSRWSAEAVVIGGLVVTQLLSSSLSIPGSPIRVLAAVATVVAVRRVAGTMGDHADGLLKVADEQDAR
ncbi:MAG: O-antigen ligase family protein [Actinomycetia bacterium]|nr:O-antigen ligase family protein [Actinomycetes bacterium]